MEIAPRLETPTSNDARREQIKPMILAGKQYKEIADHLGITARTVKYHVREMYTRAGVTNRLDYVIKTLNRENEPTSSDG